MENKSGIMNITVKSVVDIIFRNKRIIIFTFSFCIFLTFIGLQFITRSYDANVKMLIKGQSVISSETYAPIMGSVHMTQAEIVKSHAVLKRAAIALNLHQRPLDYEKNYCSNLKKYYIDYLVKKANKELNEYPPEKREEMRLDATVADLKDRLTVSMVPGTDIFVINVTAFTPDEAIETANIISRSYTLFDQIQQLAEVRIRYGEFHPTVMQLEDNIREVTNNLSGKALPDIEAIGTASVKVIEQAISSGKPVSKSKRNILAVALFIAICISFGLALVIGLFDWTIKTPQDIADYADIPCIGSIPKKQRKDKYLINEKSPETKYYNFYEEMSEQLFVFLRTQGLKTLVITSPYYNKNHKYIVPNIGYFLSQIMGNKILLIDTNFNKPQFQKIYSLDEEKAFDSSMTMDMSQDHICKVNLGPDVIPVKINSDNLKPSNILENINFRNFINNNKNEYDAIFIDATSINNMKDVSLLSEYSDGSVIIIDEGKINRNMLKNSLPRFKGKNGIIIGGILNNRSFPIPDFIYKYFKYFLD